MRNGFVKRILLLCVDLIYIHLVHTIRSGFQTRITQRALTEANNVAMSEISRYIHGSPIDNINNKDGNLYYEITNIRVTEFIQASSSSMVIVPDSGLRWRADNIGITLTANWRYEFDKIVTIKDDGRIDVSVEGLSFNLHVTIGSSPDGHPTIKASECCTDIRHVHVEFHGGKSWIYNMFSGAVGNRLKSSLMRKMCSVISRLVDDDGQRALSKLQMTASLGDQFKLDYSLIKSPLFVEGYMETHHKGEVLSVQSPIENALSVPPMPTAGDTSKMMYLWLSDYALNSLMHEAYRHNLLTYRLSRKDLPSSGNDVLNITCPFTLCIGNVIPNLKKLYPDQLVEFHMKIDKPPEVTFGNGMVNGYLIGTIEMFAVQSASITDVKSDNYLCTLSASMTATGHVKIDEELMYGSISPPSIDLKVVKSNVGEIKPVVLTFLLENAVQKFIEDKINSLGAKGVPLPVKGKLKFVDPNMSILQNALLIETDLAYIP